MNASGAVRCFALRQIILSIFLCLAQVAKMITTYSKATVLIEGYTDAKGSDSYNAKLSDRRAVSVKNWFAKHGVAANSMQTHGWGAARPVAPNKHPDGSDDPDGRQ